MLSRRAVLTIPGDPVPWTPKTTNPKTGLRFVPGRQAAHAGRIIDAWERAGLVGWLEGEPLMLRVSFRVRRPKYHYGTGRNAGQIKDRYRQAYPTGRPDLSNLVKLVEDALTTLAWADDDQVVRIEASKGFTDSPTDQPLTELEIREAL